jgi:hypothetical protein
MIEWGVHLALPSIFLMKSIIPFRLIEPEFGAIVNSIEAGCCQEQPSNDHRAAPIEVK